MLLLVVLLLLLAAYVKGVRAIWAFAGHGNGIRPWQVGSTMAGLVALLAALASPLDGLSEALFSAHMVQHLVLIVLAAPLLALGNPLLPLLWSLPSDLRGTLLRLWANSGAPRSVWRALTHPLAATALHACIVWVWHAPALYELAVRDRFVHEIEHVTLLGSALLFWWAVLSTPGRAVYGLGVLCIFATTMHGGVLGALISFSLTPWYTVHAATVRAWGMTAMEDQQLAGLIMAVPAATVYLVAALALVALWLQAVEARTLRKEKSAGKTWRS